jgi:hypothetical protein
MEMISKKELLAVTGISYGQLYRWKRERLIPEEWFIKQSSFTGQETFFPREQVLGRVRSILGMKDDYSLEELSRILDAETERHFSGDELIAMEPQAGSLVALLGKVLGRDRFSAGEAALAVVLGEAGIPDRECPEVIEKLLESGSSLLKGQKIADTILTLFVTGQEYHFVLTRGTDPPLFDGGSETVAMTALGETANRLKGSMKCRT